MAFISQQTIQKVKNTLKGLSGSALEKTATQFKEEQPSIFSFVQVIGRTFHDPEPEQLLMKQTILLWKSFLMESKVLGRINDELIQKMELVFLETNNMARTIKSTFNQFRQIDIHQYLVETLLEKECKYELDLMTRKMMVNVLCIVVNCFDEVTHRTEAPVRIK